jgi:hypothetical protein
LETGLAENSFGKSGNSTIFHALERLAARLSESNPPSQPVLLECSAHAARAKKIRAETDEGRKLMRERGEEEKESSVGLVKEALRPRIVRLSAALSSGNSCFAAPAFNIIHHAVPTPY